MTGLRQTPMDAGSAVPVRKIPAKHPAVENNDSKNFRDMNALEGTGDFAMSDCTDAQPVSMLTEPCAGGRSPFTHTFRVDADEDSRCVEP